MVWNGKFGVAGLVLLAFGLGLSGCGQPTGRVAGKVTLKNQPVPGAQLRFESAGNTEEQFRGLTNESGAIVMDYRNKGGLPVGSYKITIKHYTLRSSGKFLPPGEAGDAMKDENQAVIHTTVFERTITAGANEINFELSEGKKPGK